MSSYGEIILTSPSLMITEVKRKTSAKLFKDLGVGDKIQLSIPVKAAGQNRGTYASYIKITNLKTNEYVTASFNQIVGKLSAFILTEAQED